MSFAALRSTFVYPMSSMFRITSYLRSCRSGSSKRLIDLAGEVCLHYDQSHRKRVK